VEVAAISTCWLNMGVDKASLSSHVLQCPNDIRYKSCMKSDCLARV